MAPIDQFRVTGTDYGGIHDHDHDHDQVGA